MPKQELTHGDIDKGSVYHVALITAPASHNNDRDVDSQQDGLEPPVSEGDHVTVEIETLGDQGDGIARVERGYVVIVPDTEQNERVTVAITDVRENVAFSEVVKRHADRE